MHLYKQSITFGCLDGQFSDKCLRLISSMLNIDSDQGNLGYVESNNICYGILPLVCDSVIDIDYMS